MFLVTWLVSTERSGQDGWDTTSRLDEGRLAARSVAIDLLATLHHATADLDAIANISKLTVMVASTPDFSASIWLPIAQANSPLSQTVCAADRCRGSGLACSWRRSSGLAPRYRGRADRTSDRPGSIPPPRTTAVLYGCRSSTPPATSARAVWDQLKAARCSCRTASSAAGRPINRQTDGSQQMDSRNMSL
jgi:hypothetical protein